MFQVLLWKHMAVATGIQLKYNQVSHINNYPKSLVAILIDARRGISDEDICEGWNLGIFFFSSLAPLFKQKKGKISKYAKKKNVEFSQYLERCLNSTHMILK